MSSTIKRTILAGLLALLPFAAWADEGIGRYQAIAVPETSNAAFANRILFLDTRDGHLWEWRRAAAASRGADGEGFTYIGKLTPGEALPTQPGQQSAIGKCFTFNEKRYCE